MLDSFCLSWKKFGGGFSGTDGVYVSLSVGELHVASRTSLFARTTCPKDNHVNALTFGGDRHTHTSGEVWRRNNVTWTAPHRHRLHHRRKVGVEVWKCGVLHDMHFENANTHSRANPSTAPPCSTHARKELP